MFKPAYNNAHRTNIRYDCTAYGESIVHSIPNIQIDVFGNCLESYLKTAFHSSFWLDLY
jgi:hypothetical protein